MFHKCFHPRCTQRVPTSKFGCRKHWFALPLAHRNSINHAYRIYLLGKADGLELLRIAQRAAIDWLHRNERPDGPTLFEATRT